jgi:hypothetical protein
MVALAETNSRMKDFYDVWICANHLDFETGKLLKVVQATFKNRETDIPTDDFEVLTAGFEDLRKFAVPMFRCAALGEK